MQAYHAKLRSGRGRTRSTPTTQNVSTTEIIGDEYLSDLDKQARDRKSINNYHLTVEELREIQSNIKVTIRPVHCDGPPTNLGEASHGKLKADQLRACMTFDLPVSFVTMLQRAEESNGKHSAKAERLRKMTNSTMLLAVALRIATSHTTSKGHASQYRKIMYAYLRSLSDLLPGRLLNPIHHNALHIADFLELFGPMHGWWMFPFERVIGKLQQVNTNEKLGT